VGAIESATSGWVTVAGDDVRAGIGMVGRRSGASMSGRVPVLQLDPRVYRMAIADMADRVVRLRSRSIVDDVSNEAPIEPELRRW